MEKQNKVSPIIKAIIIIIISFIGWLLIVTVVASVVAGCSSIPRIQRCTEDHPHTFTYTANGTKWYKCPPKK